MEYLSIRGNAFVDQTENRASIHVPAAEDLR